MKTQQIKLTPYLYFRGNCEEALNFYKKALGGKVEAIQRYGDSPMEAPEDFKDKVIHASFEFDGNTIMASDIPPGKAQANGSNAAMSLSLGDAEKGKSVFNQLAEGGQVGVPFEKQFWGAWHGNLTDRFGVQWMVNSD